MLLSHRRRRPYGMRGTPGDSRALWPRVLVLLVALWLGYTLISNVLHAFGVGNATERTAAVMTIERGVVNVSLDNATPQRAESGMKVYAGDRVTVTAGGRATLTAFDGTRIRLDENSDVVVKESTRGQESSVLRFTLSTGRIWASVPQKNISFSGSILRTVESPSFTYTLPPGTEALITPLSLSVFSADGLGVTIDSKTVKTAQIAIGEGQQWKVDAPASVKGDLYAYRTPLGSDAQTLPFVIDSRLVLSSMPAVDAVTPAHSATGNVLTITSPAQGATIQGSSVAISGSVGPTVGQILIDGRNAPIDPTNHTFWQTFVPPEGATDATIGIQALDSDGAILASEKRVVHLQVPVLAAPSIESPMKTGQTYRTQAEEIVLRGTAPRGATGIMVNDYLLKLFDAEKGTWSYLAALRLANLKQGENKFDVYALYGDSTAPQKSPAATVTVLVEEGTPGVVTVSSAASSGKSSSSAGTTPQNNAPLTPGVLQITAPAETTLHGTGALLEGTTSKETETLWVNDYRLQLYKAGKTTWNYIMSPDLLNLKTGKNTFVIIARNAKGEVLDKLTYEVTYEK